MAEDEHRRPVLPHWWMGTLTLRLSCPHKRLPQGAQIVLQHLRGQEHEERLGRFGARAKASRQGLLRDLGEEPEAAEH